MLYKQTLRPLLAALALASVALAQQPAAVRPPAAPPVEVERLRAHVSHLASDKLEGRRTGTPGAERAAEYVAAEFKRLLLAPGGNYAGPTRRNEVMTRQYLQEFPYVAAVELGAANELEFTVRSGTAPVAVDFKTGEEWMPLGFSTNGRVKEAPVAFVGYGITAAEQNYDDYREADAKDKVAVAFAGTPDGANPHGRFGRAGDVRFKAAAARAAGARALVIISGEESFKDDPLARLSYDQAGGDAGLPVAVVSRGAGARILGRAGADEVARLEATARLLRSPARVFKETADIKPPPEGMLTVATDVARKGVAAANVVGVLRGSDPKLAEEVIVVGAHYDHLGRGGRSSLAPREGEIHHGADDNASGTAALLELARVLSAERAGMRRTLVFVAFGGEEEGLLGSSYYVSHPAAPLEKTVAMINLDMVGRLRGDTLMVGGVGTAAEWRAVLEAANSALDVKLVAASIGAGAPQEAAASSSRPAMPIVTGADGRVVATAATTPRFNLRLNEDGFGPSDHSSFYARRVPVLFFFTGAHEDYHKPTDTAERVNYEGLASVAEFVRRVVADVQGRDARPTFAVAKAEPSARSTGFRVYLGTVPSYGESADGMKLDAVREGSPAEAAGLKAGDKVVKLAGQDVRNVTDYTQALSGMKAGEQYEVEVMRGAERLTLKITPAARK